MGPEIGSGSRLAGPQFIWIQIVQIVQMIRGRVHSENRLAPGRNVDYIDGVWDTG